MENDTAEIICPAPGEERWWVFLVTDALLYIVCLSLCSIAYGLHWVINKKCKEKIRYSGTKIVRDFFQKLISGQTILSKILITVTLLCNLVYIALAIHRSFPPHSPEECVSMDNYELIVEIAVTTELMVFFIIRFLATNNIVLYWFNVHTIVDVITLPQVFISIGLGVDWIGLRSLRFFWLTQITTVLQFTPLVRTQDTVDGINLLIYFAILWLTSSGIIHLIETQGDPWKGFQNRSTSNTVLVYVYYIMVTISTVGYGDILPLTDLGRTFMTIFIVAGLAFFAAILPKLADLTSTYYTKSQYARFDLSQVPQHVIVCGHITGITTKDFLKDFFHPDRGETLTHVLFLHPKRPDSHLKNVLHSYFTKVHFLLGSVLNSTDLERAKIHRSTVIFILANKNADDPIQEDRANLLMVVSVKNTVDKIPVIVQLLHSHSKKLVSDIEGWKNGKDIALCLNEMKLGLLAQSCLCPGFSTLIANLFYTSDFPADKNRTGWMEEYTRGASNEIYSSTFSKAFYGKTFHEAAAICFNELNLILLAIETTTSVGGGYYINPSPTIHPRLKIRSVNEVGYFIAQCQKQVLSVATYNLKGKDAQGSVNTFRERRTVHMYSITEDSRTKEETSLVLFSSSSQVFTSLEMESVVFENEVTPDVPKTCEVGEITPPHDNSVMDKHSRNSRNTAAYKQDSEESNNIEDVILNLDDISLYNVKQSPQHNIRDHIVLCIFADDTSPHLGLQDFFKPLRSTHLPLESIKPVVIISERSFIEKEWLMIRGTPKVYFVVGSPLQWSNLKAARVTECHVCIILSLLSSSLGYEQASRDKEAILCSLAINKKLKTEKKRVQIITDLCHESNVQFLSFDDEDDPDGRIYNSVPFACGEAFSASMFDSVTCTAINGPEVLFLVEDLIKESQTNRHCNVILIPISDIAFLGKTFKELFLAKLEDYVLCIAISRIFPSLNGDEIITCKRYIITSPQPTLLLQDSDVAIALVEQTKY